jgi:hypothetical protein
LVRYADDCNIYLRSEKARRGFVPVLLLKEIKSQAPEMNCEIARRLFWRRGPAIGFDVDRETRCR